jgi:hypothetical protein
MMTESEAIECARAVAKQLGWYWSEPVGAYLDGKNWIVRTNYLGKGRYIKITLDGNTGEVIETFKFSSR